MKKITLLAAFCLFAIFAFAQNPALNVPKFKGIEITGTVDQFGTKLASQGFKLLSKEANTYLYTGRFAGQDDCLIYLLPVENTNNIASVSVMFGVKISEYGSIYSYETWEELIEDYNNLKDLLTEKYGQPTEQNEGFAQDVYVPDSYFKLHAVKEGQCEYYAEWGDEDVDKMVVNLSIRGGKSMGKAIVVVKLQYDNVDKNKDARKEILEDL